MWSVVAGRFTGIVSIDPVLSIFLESDCDEVLVYKGGLRGGVMTCGDILDSPLGESFVCLLCSLAGGAFSIPFTSSENDLDGV